jgi:hypothetical protein
LGGCTRQSNRTPGLNTKGGEKMTLQDFIDVLDLYDPETLIIHHGENCMRITGDDELSRLSSVMLSKTVAKIMYDPMGIVVIID